MVNNCQFIVCVCVCVYIYVERERERGWVQVTLGVILNNVTPLNIF